jgi:hypothetical protein
MRQLRQPTPTGIQNVRSHILVGNGVHGMQSVGKHGNRLQGIMEGRVVRGSVYTKSQSTDYNRIRCLNTIDPQFRASQSVSRRTPGSHGSQGPGVV